MSTHTISFFLSFFFFYIRKINDIYSGPIHYEPATHKALIEIWSHMYNNITHGFLQGTYLLIHVLIPKSFHYKYYWHRDTHRINQNVTFEAHHNSILKSQRKAKERGKWVCRSESDYQLLRLLLISLLFHYVFNSVRSVIRLLVFACLMNYDLCA